MSAGGAGGHCGDGDGGGGAAAVTPTAAAVTGAMTFTPAELVAGDIMVSDSLVRILAA